MLGTRVLFWSALAVGFAVCARTGWRLHESVELARLSRPLQHLLVQPSLRLLVVGDSTAVGTGATAPQASVAGLLAEHFPSLQIDNRARDGAKFAELLAQLDGEERFDMVLVMAGGNDVVRLRGLEALGSDVERVTQRARQRADLVVLMPAGNVGNPCTRAMRLKQAARRRCPTPAAARASPGRLRRPVHCRTPSRCQRCRCVWRSPARAAPGSRRGRGACPCRRLHLRRSKRAWSPMCCARVASTATRAAAPHPCATTAPAEPARRPPAAPRRRTR